jgi:hypothetical protein
VSESGVFDKGSTLRSVQARPNVTKGSFTDKGTALRSVGMRPKATCSSIPYTFRSDIVCCQGVFQPIDESIHGVEAWTASESFGKRMLHANKA